MARKRVAVVLVAILASTVLAGCIDPGVGTVQFVLTEDQPSEKFKWFRATFSNAQLHRVTDPEEEQDAFGVADDPEWEQVINRPTESFILFQVNDTSKPEKVFSEGVEPGTYNQVLLTVKDAQGVTEDGEQVDVQTSYVDFRVTVNFTVESGETVTLFTVLDTNRSLVQHNDTWEFDPVVERVEVR